MRIFKHRPRYNCAVFGDAVYKADQPADLTEAYYVLQRLPNLIAIKALILMATAMTAIIIMGNLAALKIWNLLGWPVDGGFWIFPLSYIIGDLLMEIYGRDIADWVAWFASGICVVLIGMLHLVNLLPDYPRADNLAFAVVNAATGRIFLASIAGFLASQILNNLLFDKIRQRARFPKFWQRALLSSALAHVADVLVFEPLAFLGKLSLTEFFQQAILAYVMGIAVELVMFYVVTRRLAPKLVAKLDFQHGRRLSIPSSLKSPVE